ncbi:MAG: hypothetical protein KTR24_03040 [Saprospiraceae bacterium]|nr:hypothetical protein [Saprospiraceae bacterium]
MRIYLIYLFLFIVGCTKTQDDTAIPKCELGLRLELNQEDVSSKYEGAFSPMNANGFIGISFAKDTLIQLEEARELFSISIPGATGEYIVTQWSSANHPKSFYTHTIGGDASGLTYMPNPDHDNIVDIQSIDDNGRIQGSINIMYTLEETPFQMYQWEKKLLLVGSFCLEDP